MRLSFYSLPAYKHYCYGVKDDTLTGLNKPLTVHGFRSNTPEELTRFKNFLWLHDIYMLEDNYFYSEILPQVLWKQYLDIAEKYDLTKIKPGKHKLVIADGNIVSLGYITRYVPTYEQKVFFDIHNIKIKVHEVCASCNELPSRSKQPHKACCTRYDSKRRTKHKMAYDVKVKRDYFNDQYLH